MEKKVLIQKMKFTDDDLVKKAIRYYSLLFASYKIHLPKKEVELLAFTAVRGGITPLPARKEFALRFKSSLPSIENMKCKLIKKGLLVKHDNKYKISPKFQIDFTKDLIIRIDLKLKDDGQD